jgi:hypothetical protein
VSLDQLKVMSAIERCRTAALGGHVARCENAACGHTEIAYNSCLMGKSINGELAPRCIGGSVDFGNLTLHYGPSLGPAISRPKVKGSFPQSRPQWLRAFRRDPRRRQISVVAGFPRPIHDDTQRRPCVAPARDLLLADLGAQPL